jgi:hypothetical protein
VFSRSYDQLTCNLMGAACPTTASTDVMVITKWWIASAWQGRLSNPHRELEIEKK